MTTDLLPKTRRLISGSAYSRELSDFAEWHSSEGYTAAPIHIHVIYLGQARACLDLMSPRRAMLPRLNGRSIPEADRRPGSRFSRLHAVRTSVFSAHAVV
ncbi:MAG: hypothetical protein IT529_06105 [Burkholderiales bacterium]|nr:hypothetical protein [Burkholderiales bacterium]